MGWNRSVMSVGVVLVCGSFACAANQTETVTPVQNGGLGFNVALTEYDMGQTPVPTLHSFAAGETPHMAREAKTAAVERYGRLETAAGWHFLTGEAESIDRLTEAVHREEADAGLRAHAVAPGVIDTAMQETIRSKSPAEFPEVAKFNELKRSDSFNTTPFVAQHLLSIAFDPDCLPDQVVLRLPPEKP